MFFSVMCYIFILTYSAVLTEAVDCSIGGFNLTRFQTFNPWRTGHKKTDTAFDINICDVDTACSNGISVRGQNGNSSALLSYGNCTIHQQSTESKDGELMVFVRGSTCPVMPAEQLTTVFYFKCGKALGQPVYLGDFGCSVIFEWESLEFCTNVQHPAHEIPCYVYNNSEIIDLSPLTKLKGGYLVDQQPGREYYINVCRDITPDSTAATGSCPNGAGSCRIMGGSGSDFGQLDTKLEVVGKEIKMTYTTAETPYGCSGHPKTVVSFRCPERGGSKQPQLLRDFDCNVQIEWWTEYACPQQTLTSETCQLTMESHDIDIDLSPLTKPSSHPYHLTVNASNGNSFDYYINVCDQLGIPCGEDQARSEAVCQVQRNTNGAGTNLGDSRHMQLTYSDRQLSLTYKDGDACDSKFRRNTIINFQCDQNAANGGKGEPEFREDIDCTFVFDWKTRYACVDHPQGSACNVEHDGKLFDLSDLTLERDRNWLALSDQKGDYGYQYFLNVCHDVLHVGGAEHCPAGAAVCRKGYSDSHYDTVSLGSYRQGLQYDPVTQNIYINYTMGSPSGHECSGTINSLITFICKPGDLESGPALVDKSPDECMYQFEWYTAAACPMSHQQGKDCRVVDTQAGFSFDLSGLMKKSGDGYKVSHDSYDYYINVCGKISGEHCKDANAAVCQVEKDGPGEFKTGEPSQNLEYFNGVLNLTYTNGDPYNDGHNTHRKTEIAFICDMAAGAGHPEFLVEQNHTYSFKWLTAYACPAQPIECVAQDDAGKQYDLSSLSKSAAGENWVVLDDGDPANRRKFYINVCRPLAPIYGLTSSAGCDLNAAVCETALSQEKESVLVANLGQVKNGPKVKVARDNFLSLEYTDGSPCPDGGDGSRYNITIHFICSQGQQSRGPSPPRKVGPCSYEAIWDTSAACALKETDSGESGSNSSSGDLSPSCTITDGGHIYNLISLKKSSEEYYTAHSGSRTFRLNICGAVSSSNCDLVGDKPASVCEVQSQHNTGLTVASAMDLKLTEENNIMVTYTGQRDPATGQMTEVQIELACNRLANESAPITFVDQTQQTYQFRLETPASCPLHPVDCVVQDRKGNQYDLTPLAKITGNYDVPDPRSSHSDLHYLINVCRPINEVASSACPGGPIGGCQTGGRDSYSLGYVESKPHVAEDGTITLRYIGGSVCHSGTPQEARRTMRINLYCSHVGGLPQFIGESDSCEYTFTWSTPSACPLQRSLGADCKVSDPLYGFQFDLNPLRKTDSDYQVAGEAYTFQLNVCGPLHSPPEECTGMGVCQKGSSLSAAVAAGKTNSKLIYDTGELSLVYDDGKDKCHGKYTRKTIITFVCDHSKPGANSGPQYMSELEDCTYTFVWTTALACPPHGEVDCSYVDPKTNYHYDLSSLSMSGANYVKPYGDVSYIINICRSLVHRKGETCPFNSAACMINSTETELSKKYQSLGEVTSNPVSVEGNQLVIRYNNGAPCSKGGNMSTLIILSCPTNPTAEEAGPSSHFVRDYCQHGFVWKTSAACPVGSDNSQGNPTSQSPCRATNPVSHYEFDLSKLQKSTGSYQVNDREGHYFYINVCGAVDNAKCNGSSAGSCQTEINGEERAFNAGNMNANLQYLRNGLLMLNYSGGDICHHNNVPRTTIINFICHQGAGDGVPSFIDNSDGCVYYFDWHTELACEEKVLCEVNTGKETFDLSPLIKQSGHHLAVPDLPGSSQDRPEARGTFYINVCRPLNPIFNTLCPAGSAACREVVGQPPQSLGQARSEPVYDTVRKQVTLTYDHGQPCANNSSTNASTVIIFICKKGFSQGVPRLVDISQDCAYVFEWETNLVCSDDALEKETVNCTYYDQRTDFLFDLSTLKDMQQVDSPQGGKISIQACGSVPSNLSASCQGSAVCLVGSRGLGSASLLDGSYGSASTGQFQMDDQRLKLSFTDGQGCQHESKTASTNIFFECDNSAGNGQPEPLPHFSCELNFNWRTSLICPPLVEDCVTSWKDTAFDLAILSQTRESWEFIHQDGSRYWINLCQAVHGEALKQKCPPNSAVCRHTKDGQVDMLGDLRSQKIFVEDDGTVVIEYSQGTSACSSSRRRSNNPLARSLIRLSCGSTVGSPVLTTSKENTEKCLFEFTWKTRAVCKKDSLPQVLSEVNQVIQDRRSGGKIDLRSLLKGGNHQAFDGKFLYIVNLEGHLALDHSNTASGVCTTAAVCQQLSNNATYHHNLGTYVSRHYYLNEDQLEVEYTSTEKCTGKYSHKYVSSIITFSCSSSDRRTDPVFRYRTVDCTYIFTWETPAACMQAKIEVATGSSVDDSQQKAGSEDKGGGINRTTLATIVSIFSCVLIICLLAVVFHKPERRAAAADKLKKIIFCRRNTENQIRYSVLAQMEEDPDVEPVGTNPFEEDMENELQNGDTMGIKGYHDDSDDDMLL